MDLNQPFELERGHLESIAQRAGLVVEAQLPQQTQRSYLPALDIGGGIALIQIAGALSQRVDPISRFLGFGIGYPDIRQAVSNALQEKSIKALVLDVDSPGGTVAGSFETAEYISQANGIKPVYVFTGGMLGSAAYKIASGAREISGTPTAQIGSIGTYTMHLDYSKMLDRAGVKQTYIQAGKFKTVGKPSEPLSDSDRAYIQARVDGMYRIFLETVAKNRGLAIGNYEEWAEGAVYLTEEATRRGLADSSSTFDGFINHIREEIK